MLKHKGKTHECNVKRPKRFWQGLVLVIYLLTWSKRVGRGMWRPSFTKFNFRPPVHSTHLRFMWNMLGVASQFCVYPDFQAQQLSFAENSNAANMRVTGRVLNILKYSVMIETSSNNTVFMFYLRFSINIKHYFKLNDLKSELTALIIRWEQKRCFEHCLEFTRNYSVYSNCF